MELAKVRGLDSWHTVHPPVCQGEIIIIIKQWWHWVVTPMTADLPWAFPPWDCA